MEAVEPPTSWRHANTDEEDSHHGHQGPEKRRAHHRAAPDGKRGAAAPGKSEPEGGSIGPTARKMTGRGSRGKRPRRARSTGGPPPPGASRPSAPPFSRTRP